VQHVSVAIHLRMHDSVRGHKNAEHEAIIITDGADIDSKGGLTGMKPTRLKLRRLQRAHEAPLRQAQDLSHRQFATAGERQGLARPVRCIWRRVCADLGGRHLCAGPSGLLLPPTPSAGSSRRSPRESSSGSRNAAPRDNSSGFLLHGLQKAALRRSVSAVAALVSTCCKPARLALTTPLPGPVCRGGGGSITVCSHAECPSRRGWQSSNALLAWLVATAQRSSWNDHTQLDLANRIGVDPLRAEGSRALTAVVWRRE
jgi:hypothetical protein